jgi:hypothetical protein
MWMQFVRLLQIGNARHRVHLKSREQDRNLRTCRAHLFEPLQRRRRRVVSQNVVVGTVALEQFPLDRLQILDVTVNSHQNRFHHWFRHRMSPPAGVDAGKKPGE